MVKNSSTNPKLIQISTGQILIGNITETTDGSLTIKDPFEVSIQPMQGPNGQMIPQAAMFPFAMMSKSREFTFKNESIVFGPQEADDGCSKNWIEATTGIEMVSGSIDPNEVPSGLKGGLLIG